MWNCINTSENGDQKEILNVRLKRDEFNIKNKDEERKNSLKGSEMIR